MAIIKKKKEQKTKEVLIKIEETGTFEELLEQKGYFYSLYHISQ